MSSARFEITLTPDPRIRRGRLFFGLLAYTAGMALIIATPLGATVTVALAACWLTVSYIEIRAFMRGAAALRSIRLDERGILLVTDRHGAVHVATLLPGSMLIANAAWFRIQVLPGLVCGELILASQCGARDWRRLQVLWRIGNKSIGVNQ